MATPWTKDVKFCPSDKFTDEKGNWNSYRTSNVRGILSDMANSVFERKSLLLHTVDLVADNGDCAYGKVKDPVFILTCDEYRKYREFIPHYDRLVWTATPWGCGDKDSDAGGIERRSHCDRGWSAVQLRCVQLRRCRPGLYSQS